MPFSLLMGQDENNQYAHIFPVHRLSMAIISASLPVTKPCILWVGRKLFLTPVHRITRTRTTQPKPSHSGTLESHFSQNPSTTCTTQQILDEGSLFYRLWVAETETDLPVELSTLDAHTHTSTEHVDNQNIVMELGIRNVPDVFFNK